MFQILKTHSHKASQLFILEPAFKKVARDLQALRDAILKETPFRVLAPCLHQETCPLNVTTKSDWCHFLKPWTAPKFIQDFDKATGLKKNNLMYSYLFCENSKTPKHQPHEFLAISNTIPEKGRLELIGCGTLGRARLIRSNKNASVHNQDFERVHRGQYFECPDFQDKDFSYERNINLGKNHKFFLKEKI